MTRLWTAALAAGSLVVLPGCTSTSTAPQNRATNSGVARTKVPTSPAVVPTKPKTVRPTTALTFPQVTAGEVARVTLSSKGVSATTRNAPTKGSFMVHAACSAAGPRATVTYNVLDERPSTPTGQRTLSSGEVSCDGTVTVNRASPLAGDGVHINLTHVSEHVTSAYAVIVPE